MAKPTFFTSTVLAALFCSHIVNAQDDCFRWEQTLAVGDIRYDHAMAYDSARHVFVLFGGAVIPNGPYSTNWTIEWDGVDFAVRDVYTFPTRSNSAMVYDSRRGVCVLFGGGRGPAALSDTWTWDGASWKTHDAGGPSARWGHAMAYDDRRHVVVLFGGFGGGSNLGDTWEWNGSSWSQVATQGPAPRDFHAMTYDSARSVSVLFGGVTYNGTYLGDTWEWNGANWMLRAVTGPPPREGHAMAFDRKIQRTILFGGVNKHPETAIGDAWSWDGIEWNPLPDGPSPRFFHKMAYDVDRGVTVVDGGVTFSVPHSLWNGPDWTISACDIDSDEDGVPDAEDDCPESDTAAMLVIDDCDTGISNKLQPNGCTMADDIKQCADQAPNHGGFVSCVSATSQRWFTDGLLPRAVKGDLMRCAAHAHIP